MLRNSFATSPGDTRPLTGKTAVRAGGFDASSLKYSAISVLRKHIPPVPSVRMWKYSTLIRFR